MRRLARRLLTLCCVVSLPLYAAGCLPSTEEWAQEHCPWGYVYDVGDTREIGEWTLSQNSPREIFAGMRTLLDMIRIRPAQAEDAVDGFVLAYAKLLGGWPGYDEHELPRLEFLRNIRRMIANYAQDHYPPDAITAKLLAKLELIDPDADTRTEPGTPLFHP